MGGNRNRWQLAHLSISFKPSTLKFTEALGFILKRIFFFCKANSQQWWWIVKARGKIEQLLLYPMQYVEKLLLNLFFTLTSMWLCSKPHSSQFHSFCSMKCSCQMFQNFWYSNLKRILWKSTLDFFNEIWHIFFRWNISLSTFPEIGRSILFFSTCFAHGKRT